MSDADVTEIAAQTMMVAAKVAAPVLLTALLVTGNWVLSELVSFTHSLFDSLPRLLDRT